MRQINYVHKVSIIILMKVHNNMLSFFTTLHENRYQDIFKY